MTTDKDSSPAQAGPDFKAVARIAQRIRLQDVRLRWSQLGRFNEKEVIDSDWARKAFLSFDSQAFVNGDEDDRGSSFLVQCLFQLQFFSQVDSAEADHAPESDESNPPDVAVEAVFDLTYAISDWSDTEPDDFQHFAMANGTHNAWPYWREFAQSMSVRLGLDPYIAGPFKLPSKDDPQTPQPASDESS